jgi:isoleucyl-tRNA synthetase
MLANARADVNILFGWHAADEARRELLVLWNVYAFLVTYARLAGWAPPVGLDVAVAGAPPSAALDRWILSRAAGVADDAASRLRAVDAVGATRALSAFIDDLSTWYLRRSRDRMRPGADPTASAAAFTTLHAALVVLARTLAPILPFLSETLYQNLIVSVSSGLPDSVHLTAWPAEASAGWRDPELERTMATARQTVELARVLRAQAGIRTRQPLARAWIAAPDRDPGMDRELLELIADEINVKAIEPIDSDSGLVERRVKVLLPKVGRRLGPAIPAVMAAARDGSVEFNDDGSVSLAGQTLTADEIEIQATPRPGTAVAEHDGIVVVLDTELTPALRAEGDARELARAVQDLRREAALELDDRIELWVVDASPGVAVHLASVAGDTLAELAGGDIPSDAARATVALDDGPTTIALRRIG